jgi:hypothetical protein
LFLPHYFLNQEMGLMVLEPGNMVEAIERGAELPGGSEERFSGYGVVGLPFKSGHILCLRRWPASSLGQSYTSLWHRNPEDRWTFIQDAPPQLSCTRYFGSAVSQHLNRQISITWTGQWDFSVDLAGDYEVHWQVSLGENFTTQLLNVLGGMVPGFLWRRQGFLKLLERLGGFFMGSGRMSLTGRLPNGQKFITHPRYMWNVASSRASVRGQDVGEMGPLAEQARLGDFWIPQQGRFFIGQAFLENFDPDRHLAVFSQEG